LLRSRVLIIGCGALGTAQAESLARAGVGHLRLLDRDFVESSNLQRQTMFTERDAHERLPKSIACAAHLAEINSAVQVESEVADVNHTNIERFIQDCDVVLDGTDNYSTRYLINDACVKHQVNWVYGAAVGSCGATMTVRPGTTPCLRCVFETPPQPGSAPTCDTAGVIMPIISVVAAIQVSETLKLLMGRMDELHGSLMQVDIWSSEWHRIALKRPWPDCPTCGLRQFTTLDAEGGESTVILCGHEAVQISPSSSFRVDLALLAERLRNSGEVKLNPYLLRFHSGDYELTVFPDARAIIRGTDDVQTARSLYARFVGA
jgi:molybdopterin-synthase adenylyltransferase